MTAFAIRLCILMGVFLAHTVRVTATTSPDNNDQGGNFTIVNGQIFTPGLAIIDAPQPFTPLGGGEFQTLREVYTYGLLVEYRSIWMVDSILN
jgi:hypothetical protein